MIIALLIWAIVATLLASPIIFAAILATYDWNHQRRVWAELKRDNKCGTPWCVRGYEHDGICERVKP